LEAKHNTPHKHSKDPLGHVLILPSVANRRSRSLGGWARDRLRLRLTFFLRFLGIIVTGFVAFFPSVVVFCFGFLCLFTVIIFAVILVIRHGGGPW
jgi:hypothetical protein